ncbi:hypothetical protein [Oceanithermus profundus]|uniref:Uncharacterized protein n=1 Tax=Oceanithermus profundus (strain DSM 14977 / NBRC 100410 / VKM B-2274 / 506) TaxID=670487 RepID=E4U5G9_OCEP5|nr:hypothetical protein [Oceanithermus profundus]ADR35472.1 hypothetical protein Ocepr_0006 [Oceanithermus profundus DSM 14977]
MRRWWQAAWVTGVLEGWSRSVRVWTHRAPAWVWEQRQARTPLSLGLPYYPARGARGIELVPKDAYLQEVEDLLFTCTAPPEERR